MLKPHAPSCAPNDVPCLAGNAFDFDAKKVERMAGAIRNGTFRADAEAIADKLISRDPELLFARQSH
jgi:hypothetical protein